MAELTGVRSSPFLRTPEVLVSNGSAGTRHMQAVRLAGLVPAQHHRSQQAQRAPPQPRHLLHVPGRADPPVLELVAMLGTLDLVAKAGWVAVLPGLMMADDAAGGSYVYQSSRLAGVMTEWS